MGLHRVEDIGVGLTPLGREIVARMGADIDGVGALLEQRLHLLVEERLRVWL